MSNLLMTPSPNVTCDDGCDCGGYSAFLECVLAQYDECDEWLPELLWRIHVAGVYAPELCVEFADHFWTAIWNAKEIGASNAEVVEGLAAHVTAWGDGSCSADHNSEASKQFDPRTRFALRFDIDPDWRNMAWGAKYSIHLVPIDGEPIEHGNGFCPLEVATDRMATVIEDLDWYNYGRMTPTEAVVWLHHLDHMDGQVSFSDWAEAFEVAGWQVQVAE